MLHSNKDRRFASSAANSDPIQMYKTDRNGFETEYEMINSHSVRRKLLTEHPQIGISCHPSKEMVKMPGY